MKTNKRLITKVSVTMAALLLTTLTYLIGYSRGAEETQTAYQAVDVATAKSFHQAYYRQAGAPSGPVRAFAINTDQYSAMGQLLSANPGLTGFKVYYGSNSRNEPVMMVLGTHSGKDNTEAIFLTSASDAGLCPTICDMSSPLIAE